MLQRYSSALTIDGLHEAIEEFLKRLLNIIEEHVFIVFDVDNNVNNNVNTFVNNSVYSPEDLDVMQTL